MARDGSREEARGMTASEQLRDLVNGIRTSQALHVAAVLGVSDLLADGPLYVESLARAADADPGIPSPAAPCSGRRRCLRRDG
jgi:hypothetical protein